MNILFISSQFPNSVEPNKGTFTKHIASALAKKHSLHVISPIATVGWGYLNRFKKYPLALPSQKLEALGTIPVHYPQYFAIPFFSSLHHLSLYRSLAKVINQINQSWHIDAINCHWLYPDGVAAQKICENLKIPVMLTALGSDLNRYLKFKLRQSIILRAMRNADAVSVLNHEMFDLCVSSGINHEHVSVIPNGVDLNKFVIRDQGACRSKLSIPPDHRIVLFVGSLYPVKNVATLISAFHMLSRETGSGAEVLLYIAGNGYLKDELKSLAASLSLTDKVVFLGQVPHEELPFLMSAADCLCLPSFSEGHPNVMMESLACGTPVVGSKVGSMPDFLDPEVGVLVSPHSVDELAMALRKCLGKQYDRASIRRRVADFTWERCADSYCSCLETIVRV